jgi:hypothetical protein
MGSNSRIVDSAPAKGSVSQKAMCHIGSIMTTYTVRAIVDGIGFEVEIAGVGAHQSILRFGTEDAANAWIAQDKRRTHVDEFFGSPAAPECGGGSDGTDPP